MKKNYIFICMILMTFISSELKAQCTTTAYPYLEDFSGITANNQLPQCWTVSNPATCLTFTTVNSKYAAFGSNPTGASHFFSKAFYLQAGVVYSVSLWYRADIQGSTNWSSLSVLYGTSQSTTGLSTLATTVTTNVAAIYSPLSNTFSVPTGTYYLAVSAVSNATGTSQQLWWDDLEVSIPCSIPQNVLQMSVTPSTATICAGKGLNAIACCADTYTWFNGSSNSAVSFSPSGSGQFTVSGSSAQKACDGNASISVTVQQSPLVAISVTPAVICSGQLAFLTASGALSYSWSNGSNSSTTNVQPFSSQGFTVIGAAANSCTAKAALFINVNQLPTLTVSVSDYTVCPGEQITLSAAGAFSYTWTYSGSSVNNFSLTDQPLVSTAYSVTGIDANGCENTETVLVNVDACTGYLSQDKNSWQLHVYPNPCREKLKIEQPAGLITEAVLLNIQGRVLIETTLERGTGYINLGGFDKGIYFLQVKTGESSELIKILKED